MHRLKGQILSRGIHLDVLIGVSGLKRRQLTDRGMDVPSPANVQMIVDTGADSTMIDSSVILGLRLTNPTSTTRIFTSTTGAKGEACDVFDAALTIRRADRTPLLALDPFSVISRHLPNHSIEGMLGRDLPNHLVLRYDGPRGEFLLEA